jgi:hypothetical protein
MAAHPVGTLKAFDGFCADLASFDAAQHGVNSSVAVWLMPIQESRRKGRVARRLHQPLQDGKQSQTRAVARMPKPSAKQATTRTMSSTAACLPWKSVPCVSKK